MLYQKDNFETKILKYLNFYSILSQIYLHVLKWGRYKVQGGSAYKVQAPENFSKKGGYKQGSATGRVF